jgi:hypothetical protein
MLTIQDIIKLFSVSIALLSTVYYDYSSYILMDTPNIVLIILYGINYIGYYNLLFYY